MLLLLLSAIFPVVVFLFFVYRKDTEKEPPKLLAKCFLWGCIAVLPIMGLEFILDYFNIFTSAFLHSFYNAFIVAAFVEEGVKLMCLYWLIWKHKEFDQYVDGIVYAVFVSLGFALVENVLYVLSGGFGTSISRAILSVPAHGLFGVVMGYFFALARFSKNSKKLLYLSFLIPFLFHGLYDFFLFFIEKNDNVMLSIALFIAFIAIVIWLWRTGLKHVKKHYTKDIENNTRNTMTE